MKRLSIKEWIAVAAAVIFVGYTLFGGDIMSLFQKNAMNENPLAAVGASNPPGSVVVSDIVVGQGAEIKPGQSVSVHYILSLPDGSVVQNSKEISTGAPFRFTFGAGDVIPGWEQGIAGMKVGGVRTIVIPSELAYGAEGYGPVPPNSAIIFTIEVVDATDVPNQ